MNKLFDLQLVINNHKIEDTIPFREGFDKVDCDNFIYEEKLGSTSDFIISFEIEQMNIYE